ncbi:SRPBCC family protein [Mycobacterium sp. AMU20-3851]|uniref:SRPBCC family protein n=1 Tax=Mycobacterium sp. AMU20-3851 TaxID=3122055 RepID=UPI003754F328
MIEMEREVVTSATPADVFAYLADFTTTEQWEPGTVRTTRIAGDGGVGTRYANTSRFAGRTSDLEYEVIGVTPGRSIQLRGQNDSLIAHDTITVRPHDGGSRVTYRIEFAFQGWLRLGEPLLRIPVTNLMDKGVEGLERELAKI